jgi:hypothetical protein
MAKRLGDSTEATAPPPDEWLAAATEVRTTVVVGSRDLELRPERRRSNDQTGPSNPVELVTRSRSTENAQLLT